MSEADYENLMKMYGWKSPFNPILYIVILFLLIAIFLLLPYIYIRFFEPRLVVSETSEIDDWFTFRKTYPKSK